MLDGHHPSKLVHDDVLEERERGHFDAFLIDVVSYETPPK